MYGPVAEELRTCGWGSYTREASVWEACCWCSGVINVSLTVSVTQTSQRNRKLTTTKQHVCKH